VLYIAESELGPDAISFAAGPSPYLLQTQLTGLTRTTFPHGEGEDIKLTGYLHDPWRGL
jgi:diaminohydroxyphosphoribosylaminopyrimidine deaminase/5-amino-6-(5-phosphoribosylamino)uracil reductase